MDGTLIDSEHMWKEAESKVFTAAGVRVSVAISSVTAAMTTTEVTQYWYSCNPWDHKTLHQVENEVVDCVDRLIRQKGEPMEGVMDVLAFFKA